MNNNQSNFRFWVPLDVIEKSGEGLQKLKVGGIASTNRKDMDGESLDPNGFDLSYFQDKGIVNWNHNKSPDAIIGEPTSVKVTKDGLYVEAELYGDNPLAKSVYSLAQTLQKSSKTRRLGFSIEGKAVERDPKDKTTVSKALITNIALTISPKNPDSIVNIIKGNFNELESEQLQPYDYDFDYERETEKLDKIEKALNTSDGDSGKPLIKESVEGVKKNIKKKDEDDDEEDDEDELLTKSIVVDKLMKSNSVITFEKANQIVEILNNIEMANKKERTEITEDTLEKALSVLGLVSESDDLSKGSEDSLDDDTDDEDEVTTKKVVKKSADVVDEDDDESDDEDTDDDDEDFKKKDLKKSIDLLASENIEMFKGTGTLLKGIYDLVSDISGELTELRAENVELKKSFDELGEQPVGVRKSTSKAVERTFEKGFNEGNDQPLTAANVISVSQNKPQILSLLDSMAFEKGYNPEIGKSMTMFESSGTLSQEIISLIRQEKGVMIVK